MAENTTAAERQLLSPEALDFVTKLHNQFKERRLDLLKRRGERQLPLRFLEDTADLRNDPGWRVAETPLDLQKRHVEITGPTDRKMVINALNSGADVFMADFEDANSPTWQNMIEGQKNLIDAVEGTISFENPDGKSYSLNRETAKLFVRPRGWHMSDKNILVEGEEISASLLDFGLFIFHNGKRLLAQGKTPAFYLPKLESRLEARLWRDVFAHAEKRLGIPEGSIRATVLIETLPAAFEMEEILYELRDYSAGLNAGRWDYIFSAIKTFKDDPGLIFPCREEITMTVPFMRAYAKLLVRTCHKRGAHAMGGMAAFIPNKSDPEVTERALRKVREDKQREAGDGFDGTWVAHPALVSVAREIFDEALGERPHQKEKLREDVTVSAGDLVNFEIPGGTITEACARHNISVAIQYLCFWLSGRGAAALYNLMEDAATAEISRSQIWQWLKRGAMEKSLVQKLFREEKEKIEKELGASKNLDNAASLIEELAFADQFPPFLTLPAYRYLHE